ncbi:DNA polymerase domain-containing protein, partial [Mesorhizobium sp.]|uniref:DNA polymerase domain-containing protein n=1 Tax=Mesorhizobium sp. TaxID=1871066 RepID=UPI000FE799E2
TVDAFQNLRFGTYQLRRGDELHEAGIFFNSKTLSPAEIQTIRTYAAGQGMSAMPLEYFQRDVMVKRAYELRASIIGFNLPFDISRVAARYNSARGKAMKGGFTFQLCDAADSPYVQIKHLSARAALIQFAQPKQNQLTRSQRRKGIATRQRRGTFIDLKTLAAALFSRSFSLASLANFLKTPSRKMETAGHGQKLTAAYLDYAVQDTQVTWECYAALKQKFDEHGLTNASPGKILSEASMGKAYLKSMGIRPLLKVQPDYPGELLGQIMSSYYGGRSEVHIRRKIVQVLYCDFLSMYPTVCTLMNLWQFVVAGGVSWRDSRDATNTLLHSITPEDLQRPAMWPQLRTLVCLRPNDQILPVRAKYDGQSPNIGVNYLKSEFGLWYTLADVIASKFLTGKTPVIDQAFTFSPLRPQKGLGPILIAGRDDYEVDSLSDDFYRRLIDLRQSAKAKMKQAKGDARDQLNADQQTLKILANSTSYGIFMELVTSEENESARKFFGADGKANVLDLATSEKVEDPGPFFHPLLGTLITGAARLMLALAETKLKANGLDWAFCDTDSMAIAKPDGMSELEFFDRATRVCAWFDPLNPYEQKASLFKIEDANHRPGTQTLQTLFCFCISSKRYALFNSGDHGEIIIRKASAHGLGHLRAPYEEDDAPESIPTPNIDLAEIGVERWQYDLWMKILEAANSGKPALVDLDYHTALSQPAVCRYSATSPDLLRWFRKFNEGKPAERQVKPFNFLYSLMAQEQEQSAFGKLHERRGRGRPKKKQKICPVAPFDRSPAKATKNAFDRETGERIDPLRLKTYREAIAQYHLHPEAKFANADFHDRGITERRHIEALLPSYIGKESNALEEQYFTGYDEDALLELGAGDAGFERIFAAMTEEISIRKLARKTGVSAATIAKAKSRGMDAISRGSRKVLEMRMPPQANGK